MSASVSDSERRTDIAERTRRGLEEDLEDLRERLRSDLADFEERVRTLAAEPPEWTGLEAPQLRAPFEIRHDELAETAWIGPRVVAVLAGEVEQFVLGWLPPVGASDEQRFRGEDLETLIGEGRELLALVADVERQLEAAVDRGHVVLDELWETSLARLDERRESDIDALHDLVGEGELETGPDAQKERASLWEEQRRKADKLRERWDRLHELIDQGADYTREGLEDLRAMARRACDGLEGAYPAVAERGVVDAIFDGTAGAAEGAEASPGSDPSDASEESPASEPSESPDASVDSDGTEASGGTDASERREAAGDSEVSETQPADETPAASDASVDSWLRNDGTAEAATEVRETSPSKRTPESDDGGGEKPTEPMITSAGELREEGLSDTSDLLEGSDPHERPEPSEVSDATETDGEPEHPDPHEAETVMGLETGEAAGGADAGAPSDLSETSEVSEASDVLQKSEPSESAAPTGGSPMPEDDASSSGEVDLPESLEAQCIRIRTEWEPVGWPSLLAALGPPVGFLLGLVVLSWLHLAEVTWAINPVEAWSWTRPAVGVALVWCLCAPLLMRWHPRWAGWRFQFVREAEIRDDTTLELDEEGFTLDRVSFNWEAVQHYRIRRWEAPDDDMVGWLLVVEPAYYDALTIIAPEHDRRRWEQGDGRVLEPPSDAWQIDSKAFDRMTAFLEGTSSDLP